MFDGLHQMPPLLVLSAKSKSCLPTLLPLYLPTKTQLLPTTLGLNHRRPSFFYYSVSKPAHTSPFTVPWTQAGLTDGLSACTLRPLFKCHVKESHLCLKSH